MVLSTHAVVGGFLGRLAQVNPVGAFVVGFLSHFLLDAIPHWDYPLRSRQENPNDKLDVVMPINRDFALDLVKIAVDLLLGFSLVFFFKLSWWAALGSVLPDFLQFAYFKLKWPVLRELQSFHIWIHAEHELKDWPIIGPLMQIILIAAVIILAKKLL